MIISASRKTDIPAFYPEWFMKRIEEGYFVRVNPFNPRQQKRFDVNPDVVDCIVFWTKNPSPIMPYLPKLDHLKYHYYFQYTLNGYPKLFEPRTPSLEQSLETFKSLAERLTPGSVVWRYDPIILSNLTPVGYHLETFERIASSLKGYVQRCVISFLDFYRKVDARLARLEREHGVVVYDITSEDNRAELLEMCRGISRVCSLNGMEVVTCAEELNLTRLGILPGRCIDPDLIEHLFHRKVNANKDPNQRDACLCAEAVDIGMYDTCRYECAYCYATMSFKRVAANLRNHDPSSPLLIGCPLA